MLKRVALLIAVVATVAATPRQPAAPTRNVLTVTGTGRVEVPTTLTRISATIEKTTECHQTTACSGRPAQQQVAAALTNIIEYLRSVRAVSDLTTTSVELTPQYNYTATPPVLVGFRCEIELTESDLKLATQIPL